MKSILSLVFCLCTLFHLNAQITITTPSSDSLFGIAYRNNLVITVGKEGVFTSSDAALSFTEITNFASVADQNLYDHTVFYDCAVIPFFQISTNVYYYFACGTDTLTQKGVIFCSSEEGSWSNTFTSDVVKCFKDICYDTQPIFLGENHYVIYNNNSYQELLLNAVDLNSNYKKIKTSGGLNFSAISDNTHSRNYSGAFTHNPINLNIDDYCSTYNYSTNSTYYYGIKNNNVYYSPSNMANLVAQFKLFTCNKLNAYNGAYLSSDNGIYCPQYVNLSNPYMINGYKKIKGTKGYNFSDLKIYDFNSVPQDGYGCTTGGQVFKIQTFTLLPTVYFDPITSQCINHPITVQNRGETSNTYSWYVNNVLVATSYNLVNYTFQTPGNYEVKLIGVNGGISDSLSQIVTVSNPPSTSLNVSVSSSILCKNGIVNYSFATELGVRYALKRTNNPIPDTVFYGNGLMTTVATHLISDTTTFEIIIGYGNNFCCDTLVQSPIIVQHPKADFKVGLINANQDELVNIYDLSTHANYVNWSSENPFVLFNLNDKLYQTSYQTIGLQNIRQIAYTNEGCSDTLLLSNIISIIDTTLLNESDCFKLQVDQENVWVNDQTWTSSTKFSNILNDDYGNFYVIGAYYKTYFPSVLGMGYMLDKEGAYIAKYDKFGILKWIVNTIEPLVTQNQSSQQIKVISKSFYKNDKIYVLIAPNFGSSDYTIVSNNGNNLFFDYSSWNNSNILSVDLEGVVQKSLTFSAGVSDFTIDNNENYYLSIPPSIVVQLIDKQGTILSTSTTQNHNFVKISNTGAIVWGVYNYFSIKNLTEKNGNLYYNSKLIHDYNNSVYGFNSSNNINAILNMQSYNYLQIDFIVKYDVNGVHKWYRMLHPSDIANSAYNLAVDNNENLYLSSLNEELVDPVTFQSQNILGGIISFDLNGTYRFGRFSLGYLAPANYPNRIWEFKLIGNYLNVVYQANFGTNPDNPNPVSNSTYLQRNDSDTLVFSYGSNFNYYLLVKYDLNGNIIHNEPFRLGSQYYMDNLNNVKPDKLCYINDRLYYASSVSFNYTYENQYYYLPTSSDTTNFLISTMLPHSCEAQDFQLFPSDTSCNVDSLNIFNSTLIDYNTLQNDNIFTVEYAVTPDFQTFYIDTLNSGVYNNGLMWNFDMSFLNTSEVYYRVRSNNSNYISNQEQLLLYSFDQTGESYYFQNCMNNSLVLTSHFPAVSYLWSTNNDTLGDTTILTVNFEDTLQSISLRYGDECHNYWIDSFYISPVTYTNNNENLYFKCPGDSIQISFNNEYNYAISGYSSTVNNNEYYFNPIEDTVIYYSLTDTNSCQYSDTLIIQNYAIDVAILTLITNTQPIEIVASTGFSDYFWYSTQMVSVDPLTSNIIYPESQGWYYVIITDENNCQQNQAIYFSLAGQTENSEELMIQINNPVINGDLIISSNRNLTIEIIDLTGKVVLEEMHANKIDNFQINFIDGIYYIRFREYGKSEIITVKKTLFKTL